jgi:hypothetical protein
MSSLSIRLSLLLLAVATSAASAADLSKIERTIGKEPTYQTDKPLYCLAVFGPEAKTRVWLVLDGALLYVDRNGNGDLTEKGERVEAIRSTTEGGAYLQFDVGAIHDAAGQKVCHDLKVYGFQNPLNDRVSIFTQAADGTPFQFASAYAGRKGYDADKSGKFFTEKPADASILHFNGPTQPLLLGERRYADPPPTTFERGSETRLNVVFVNPGRGSNGSMIGHGYQCMQKIQGLAIAEIRWPARNGQAAPPKTRLEFGKPGCGGVSSLRVRVPDEAGDGKAKVTISFPDWKEGQVQPMTLEMAVVGTKGKTP